MKAVWLSRQGDGFLLNASGVAPTPPKGMFSQSPLDEEQMAGAIAQLVSDSQITTKNVNVALAENQVYTKVIDMPILSDKELATAIYWEAEQHIPVPLTTVSLVWSVLKRPKVTQAGATMQVLLVGAPLQLIAKYQKIIAMAGLTLHAMETEILSVIRALVRLDSFPPTLIISIGTVSTSLAIVREGVMAFIYAIPTGGAAINRAIAADFGLTPAQAEEYKKVYGISGKTLGGQIEKATEPILNSLLAEVQKTVSFYTQKYKDDKPIQQILLNGGTAKLPGIDMFFAKNTGIETAIANPWKVLANQELPKEIIDNASNYTIAVGLAVRDNE